MENVKINLDKLDCHAINYEILEQITEEDLDPVHTIVKAPTRVMGGFFLGHYRLIKLYETVYEEILQQMQSRGLADDDQAMVLQVYKKYPSLFRFHLVSGWFGALIHFSENIAC
jgi:putative IMPACT (imprinted ancient) family translation regulator